ncbi:hypothetical protein GCM10010228_50690 [Streptomyces massasporeus]|nr:hypothetical protein GCM10010228_50690 [Streptomyces massasporeus]
MIARLGRSDYRLKPAKVAAPQRKELVMRRIISYGQTGNKTPAGRPAESFQPCAPKGFPEFPGGGTKPAHPDGAEPRG